MQRQLVILACLISFAYLTTGCSTPHCTQDVYCKTPCGTCIVYPEEKPCLNCTFDDQSCAACLKLISRDDCASCEHPPHC